MKVRECTKTEKFLVLSNFPLGNILFLPQVIPLGKSLWIGVYAGYSTLSVHIFSNIRDTELHVRLLMSDLNKS